MRNCLTISTLFLLFMPCFLKAEVIVCLGDSLTSGYLMNPNLAYPSVMEARLREQGKNVSVINSSMSGDTTSGGLKRLSWAMRKKVDWLIISLGANDALRGLPVEETRENLRKMIHQAREKNPDVKIILAGMLAPPNMGPEYCEAFEAIYPQLAREESVLFYKFLLTNVATRPELNLADGIHPRAEGHAKIAEGLLKLIDIP